MASTTDDKREAESRKIYEALGRYVVAFEHLVHEVREICLLLMCPDLDPKAQTLAEVPLHSNFMGPAALREVFLTLVAERVKQLEADSAKKGDTFPKEDKDAILAITKQINSEFGARTKTRNEVVHAKWFIGFGDERVDGFKDAGHVKRTLTRRGLGFVKKPPQTAEDIDALTKECDDTAAFVSHFAICFVWSDGPIGTAQRFKLNGKSWEIRKS